jgi:uncharacterized membrane protein YfcA
MRYEGVTYARPMFDPSYGHGPGRPAPTFLRGPRMIVVALLLGAAIGTVSGFVGIGGGAILVPALVYAFGMTQHDAQGTSLATLLLPIGALAVWKYYDAGHVDLRLATLLAIGFAAGAYVGSVWAQDMPEIVLRKAFAVLLIGLATKTWFG